MSIQRESTIRAIQVNFADEGARIKAGQSASFRKYSFTGTGQRRSPQGKPGSHSY